MVSKPKRQTLEELFELPEDYLHGPIAAALRPGVIDATERATGRDRVLKIWRKTGTPADAELRELWRHERLQVDRIMSYPGSADVMVGVVGMIETDDAFCIVHEPGMVPLAAKLRSASRQYWLHSLNVPANRMTLWHNLARLARALGTIHAQGLIHGRIDTFAIFTEGASSPDFRLGGFEWSLVIGEAKPMPVSLQQVRARIQQLIYSYAEDWKALATVFATLVGLDPERLREDDPFTKNGKAADISDAEIDFLRRMVDPGREEILEANVIIRNIESLTRELTRHEPVRTGRFMLLFSPNDRMAEAIYTASDGAIPIDDLQTQIAFVESDLASDARLLAPDAGSDPDQLFILTETLSYRVRPFSNKGTPTWHVAVVTSVASRSDARLPPNGELYVIRHDIEILTTHGQALGYVSNLGDDALEWTIPIAPVEAETVDRETETLQRATLLVQALEALVRSLDVLPIEIVGRSNERGRSIIQIAGREGTHRDEIASAIGERATPDVLDRLFDKDDLGIDVDWLLSSSGSLASRARNEFAARFLSVDQGDSGQKVYSFAVIDVRVDDDEPLFLRRKNDRGTESLIKRKLRTTLALADQQDLVAMFVDPRRRLKGSGETLHKDEYYDALDDAKQKSLEDLWTTTPTHAVVGPPGVGKTRLVTEVVRRRLAVEPTTRFIISAQSHQALDHILGAVKKQVSGSGDALLVRSRGNDDAVSTDADVRKIAQEYLRCVRSSSSVENAPPNFRAALEALQTAFARDEAEQEIENRRDADGIRALNALVLESANVVFSTSTSQDVERLLEDGVQFDWVIIEEAAKASGPELIAPLALSGRRLLIGDHFQLPPFGADRLAKILENKESVRAALAQAESAIGSTFFETGLDELRKALESDATLETVVVAARRAVEPFRAIVVEDQERRPVVGGVRRSVTSELSVQHRMDPAIAELVSACFYDNRLTTSDRRWNAAKNPLPFSFGKAFPSSPIVFVDMPFVSRTGRAKPVESGRPRWHNPAEARMVANLVAQLRLTPANPEKPPSLAVLSPYWAQVERVSRQIEALRAQGGAEFTKFEGFAHGNRVCGTVDSSQGSEADLVIVSLVRNNHWTGVPALGFLRDRRRMNVLLSRARQQLVIVGSTEFLKEATRYAKADDELSFVVTFLREIERLRGEKSVREVPKVHVISAEEVARFAP